MGGNKVPVRLAYWEAQGGLCPICGEYLAFAQRKDPIKGWTRDHVYHRANRVYNGLGNILLTHYECNHKKGSRRPTGCEQIMLHSVNAQLGIELTRNPVIKHQDIPAGPTALEIAWKKAQGIPI